MIARPSSNYFPIRLNRLLLKAMRFLPDLAAEIRPAISMLQHLEPCRIKAQDASMTLSLGIEGLRANRLLLCRAKGSAVVFGDRLARSRLASC
jgi:hypothetical protein